MPFNPETIVGEVLGRRAVKGCDPSTTDFACPFIKSKCIKRTSQKKDEPYPVCSLWHGASSKKGVSKDLIFVCPKRFYAVDFLKEVVENCWAGPPPKNPMVAPEVKMAGFGNVDFVIADVASDGEVSQFLSVELQAIDITGSVYEAYKALLLGNDLEKRPSYGFNWGNVYKRYITQIISKGYFHHHWKSKIVAVISDQFYQYIKQRANFMSVQDVKSQQEVNIIFMTYILEEDPARVGQYKPKLVRVEGTSHSSLQNAILYKEPPQKDAFTAQIKRSLVRAVNLADLIAKAPE